MTKAGVKSLRTPREVRVPTTLTFKARPTPRKDWLEAGYVPADTIYGEFPGELFPGVAAVHVGRRIGDHAAVVNLCAAGLTDDESFGASLLESRGIVTLEEAREAAAEHRRRQLQAVN